ncbi:MAG TPA: hypothetical protein VNO32_25550, partial [Candidatus Acidoferrum sp.]|nr:hypothetical protein [Candidatus Acidoferrum sp.]
MKRRKTWNYLWYESGKRRSKLIGNKQQYPTKANAWKEVERFEVGQRKTQNGDTVRTKTFTLASELLDRVKAWKQLTQFSGNGDWIFASPMKLGRLPYSYTGVWRELVRAVIPTGIGHIGTHAFRHTYRSWLDAVGTP